MKLLSECTILITLFKASFNNLQSKMYINCKYLINLLMYYTTTRSVLWHMTVHLWLHQHLEKSFVSDQSYSVQIITCMYMYFQENLKMLLTLRLWVDRIHKDKLSSSFWIRVFNPKCNIIENYEVLQEFTYWSKSLINVMDRMDRGWWEFDMIIGVFFYTTYWMYYVYMYDMQNFDFLFRYSLVGETILRYFDNLHSVNLCRKEVLP